MTISYHRLSASSPRAIRQNRFLRPTPPPGPGRWRRLALLAVCAGLLLLGLYGLIRPLLRSEAKEEDRATPAQSAKEPVRPAVRVSPAVARLRAANADLSRQIRAQAPPGEYAVIDTAGNRVYLRRGEETLAEMVASCGSGNTLEDPKTGRSWVFDTPRGEFRIESKLTDPVWMKPDWAFIEEGEEIPRRPGERAEPGMMGDYALGIGKGYFIHGTLYTRMLGRNVSHGCVRLGDQDLERLYNTLPLGARVIIF